MRCPAMNSWTYMSVLNSLFYCKMLVLRLLEKFSPIESLPRTIGIVIPYVSVSRS